jgi:molybdenum ABC transporter molybdate-binding protein
MSTSPQKTPAIAWAADWQVDVRVRVAHNGQRVLGDGRADLLAAIDRTHSISAAARSLGMSYRHAWMLVQETNAAAGEPLVAAAVGGLKGGGAQLTPRGKLSLELFEQLSRQVRESAAVLLQNFFSPATDLTASIHLAAAISLQEVVGQLLTEYALRQPGVGVRAVFGASNELADHVLAGAPCDLFLSADSIHLDRLAAADLTRADSRVVLAANSLAAIGPKDAGDAIRKPRDLIAKRVMHVALADSASPLGKCSETYLRSLGLYETLLPKVLHVDNSRGILAAIDSGHAEAGLAFASDAANATHCKTLFTIDPAIASLEYSAAVVHGGRRSEDAQLLLEFFSTPVARRCFRRCGLALPKRSDPLKHH